METLLFPQFEHKKVILNFASSKFKIGASPLHQGDCGVLVVWDLDVQVGSNEKATSKCMDTLDMVEEMKEWELLDFSQRNGVYTEFGSRK